MTRRWRRILPCSAARTSTCAPAFAPFMFDRLGGFRSVGGHHFSSVLHTKQARNMLGIAVGYFSKTRVAACKWRFWCVDIGRCKLHGIVQDRLFDTPSVVTSYSCRTRKAGQVHVGDGPQYRRRRVDGGVALHTLRPLPRHHHRARRRPARGAAHSPVAGRPVHGALIPVQPDFGAPSPA